MQKVGSPVVWNQSVVVYVIRINARFTFCAFGDNNDKPNTDNPHSNFISFPFIFLSTSTILRSAKGCGDSHKTEITPLFLLKGLLDLFWI